MKNPVPAAAWLILLLALLLRVGYVAVTPEYTFVHDASDYDRHAMSIARGDGYPGAQSPDRVSAFRPPAYPYLLAGAYKVAGVERASVEDRVVPARILGIVISTLIVAHDRGGRAAAVGPAGRAAGDGGRRGLPAADPRRRRGDVRAAVRAAAARRARRRDSSTGARRTAGAGCSPPACWRA